MPLPSSLNASDKTLHDNAEFVSAPPDIQEIQAIHPAKKQMLEACAALGEISPHGAEDVAAIGISWLRAALSEQSIKEIREFKNSPIECLYLKGLGFNTDVRTPENGFLPENSCVLEEKNGKICR